MISTIAPAVLGDDNTGFFFFKILRESLYIVMQKLTIVGARIPYIYL